MRYWWRAVVLASCYAPVAPDGAPCAAPGLGPRCPTGQACVSRDGREVCTSMPVAEPDAGPPPDACETCTAEDTDGDGVDDPVDNCPLVGNVDQANEDADLAGDACDPCPPFADAGDADGDGLPDACDPNKDSDGDALVHFAGFGGGLPAGWSATAFVADAGDGLATAGANQSSLLLIAKPFASTVHVWVEATLESIAGTALGAIGVVTVLEAATEDNVACQLVGTAAGATQKLRLFDNGNGVLVNEADHEFSPGGRWVLRGRQSGTSHACSATEPSVSIAGTATYTTSAPLVGLRVRSATARYHWVMVIRSP